MTGMATYDLRIPYIRQLRLTNCNLENERRQKFGQVRLLGRCFATRLQTFCLIAELVYLSVDICLRTEVKACRNSCVLAGSAIIC